MSEPATPAIIILTGTAAAALGPVLGPYVLIAFAAAVGGLLTMSRTPMPDNWAGARFVLVGMLISLVLTSPAVWLLEYYTAIPGSVALMPMSFLIAAGRNHLLTLMDKGVEVLITLMPKKGPQ